LLEAQRTGDQERGGAADLGRREAGQRSPIPKRRAASFGNREGRADRQGIQGEGKYHKTAWHGTPVRKKKNMGRKMNWEDWGPPTPEVSFQVRRLVGLEVRRQQPAPQQGRRGAAGLDQPRNAGEQSNVAAAEGEGGTLASPQWEARLGWRRA